MLINNVHIVRLTTLNAKRHFDTFFNTLLSTFFYSHSVDIQYYLAPQRIEKRGKKKGKQKLLMEKNTYMKAALQIK